MASVQETHLKEIQRQLEKINSPWRRFTMGILQGLGTAIGATLVAGILIIILNQVVRSVNDIPILNKIIPSDFSQYQPLSP